MKNASAPFRDGWLAQKAELEPAENLYSETLQPYSHSEWTAGWCQRYDAERREHDHGGLELYQLDGAIYEGN